MRSCSGGRSGTHWKWAAYAITPKCSTFLSAMSFADSTGWTPAMSHEFQLHTVRLAAMRVASSSWILLRDYLKERAWWFRKNLFMYFHFGFLRSKINVQGVHAYMEVIQTLRVKDLKLLLEGFKFGIRVFNSFCTVCSSVVDGNSGGYILIMGYENYKTF